MSLHPPVLFVGDRPNVRKNLSVDVPFVGCPSYKTLLEWCYRMDIFVPNTHIVNAFNVEGTPCVLDNIPFNFKVVTLGERAREALANSACRAEKFALPHPSGLNRDLNDKKKLNELLTRCKRFIYAE